MTAKQQLKVDLISNSKIKNKNAFANSFAFSDDFSNDNEFSQLKETVHVKEDKNNTDSKVNNKNQLHNDEAKGEDLSSNKKNKKRNRRKLFDQEEMNNTFIVQEDQKSDDNNVEIVKPQANKSPTKNQKPKNQTIQIQQNIPKHQNKNQSSLKQPKQNKPNQSPKQNPTKHYSPTKQQPNIPSPPQKVIPIIQNNQTDNQLTKITQITTNITKLNNDLKDIKRNYDSFQVEEEILFKKNNPRKEIEIRDFLMKKKMEKQHRQKKINQIREREKELIVKTIEEQEILKQQQKQKKIKQIKQIDYQKPKQNRQLYHQQNQHGKQLASSLLQKFKHHQPIHIRNQRNFQFIKQKQKEQQQQILLERKQRYQSLDLEELEDHKRSYEQRKEEIQSMRKQQREEQWNKINQDNNFLRDNIWKGPSHDIVDEEILEKKRKRKQPKQKVKKMKNYYQYIKNNFLPKTHQPKRSSPVHDQRVSQTMGNYSGRYHGPPQDQLGYDPNKRHVKKYKYYQGSAIGQVVESVPVARSYSQQKKIGQGYLQYLKNLPKKRNPSQSTTQIDPIDLQMISKKFNAVTRVKRQSLPFYQQQTQKRTVSIGQKPTKEQVKMVYEQLKNHDIKLKSKRQLIRAMKQNSPGSMDMEKEVNVGLLLNMERKLDLLAKL